MYYVGQRVCQQFPRGIDDYRLTGETIAGTIVRLWETSNAGWAIVKLDNGTARIVCLG